MMTGKGVIAAGHPETARAAAVVLESGGNAFDAALAAFFAACAAEPVLASLGGGGFLLARPADGRPTVYDFFAQTPCVCRAEDEVDFYPVIADFGTAQQEFHIGFGSIATPGAVKGAFEIHRDLCALPMGEIVAPAADLARQGMCLNTLQAYIFDVVGRIYSINEACLALFGSLENPGALVGEGEILKMPEYADTLEALARDGEALFYRGEIAEKIIGDSRMNGGHLTADDLSSYEVVRRTPTEATFGEDRLFLNPPPSTGGILIAFALELFRGADVSFKPADRPRLEEVEKLTRIMALTNEARRDCFGGGDIGRAARRLFESSYLETYRQKVLPHPKASRGTTHISVIDGSGNAASLSLSNGEGSGYIVPGTGIMMNNMLGEEDINPLGFQRWAANSRMSSMMAPALVERADGTRIVLGSGGSNRIRTAILQVLLNLLAAEMALADAVAAPRVHFENEFLNIEGGFNPADVAALAHDYPNHRIWDGLNLFFGGVHAAQFDAATGNFSGAGDPRRGGATITL